MKERYWEAIGDPKLDDLKDWVAENVACAFEEFMDEGCMRIVLREGRLVLIFSSFEKPVDENGIEDLFYKEFDLFELVSEFIDEYKNEIQQTNAAAIAEALRVADER